MNLETYINATARSASDLLADLQACRQLRHVSNDQKEGIVRFFFGDIEDSLRENRKLPGTGNKRYFVWAWEAFVEAVSVYGYSCDTCSDVTDTREDRWRYAADRMLHNLDGQTRLMLCPTCSARFSNFCQRQFQRDVRVPWSRELEQIMIAFIARELGMEARRIMAGRPTRRRGNARPIAGENRPDREAFAVGFDGQADSTIGWNRERNSENLPGAVRQ